MKLTKAAASSGILLALLAGELAGQSAERKLERVRVADDKTSFVLAESGATFVPWGFNYDHDVSGRLIEDYWEQQWQVVEEDFREMKALGANVVRIHLQFGKFMQSADAPHQPALKRLQQLLGVAERVGIYLDVTGLGCYHKQDVPPWYDQLDERQRWEAQARFWEAVAACCAHSPAVFCYDLMNEPVVPGGDQPHAEWLGPPFAGKHFVQLITRDRAGRARPEIARQWIEHLTAAIRKHDAQHLITVGMVDWSLDRPGLTSGFVPAQVADRLDFIAVHIYPEEGQVDAAIETLRGFRIGKPVVIEETFPLKCSFEEMASFLDRSRGLASGWISFYWGRTAAEYRQLEASTIGDAIVARWLDEFPAKMKQTAAREGQ